MKSFFISILIILSSLNAIGQKNGWEIGGGIGLSGFNQLIVNEVNFDNRIFFSKKLNTLDNKFRNNYLHSGAIFVSKKIENGLLKNFKVIPSFAVYTFGSTYYKEEKFRVSFGRNDTINSPNWLISKYSLPFLEIGLSRQFELHKVLSLDLGVYFGYMVELYGTSNLILLDSVYSQWQRHNFTFYKEYPNLEFDNFNYGFRVSLKLFPMNKICPIILYSQGINDISRRRFNVNQHANLWSAHVGLEYKLSNQQVEKKIVNNKANAQNLRFSLGLNYLYSLKWHRDSYYSYYFDIPRNHSGSIQADVLYSIGRLFSSKQNVRDDLSFGISSEVIYLPYSGLHYVDNEYLGKIDGLDQWLHHYDNDRYRFIYMVNGIKGKYEVKNLGFVSFMKAYPIVLHQSAQSRDLFINNKTGAFMYESWQKSSLERARNPHIFTELMVGLQMTDRQYFTFGFQWTARSSVDLVYTQYHVDNREQAFRNVKIGWRLEL